MRGEGGMSIQNCNTCGNWGVCKGSMQVGVDCYRPAKEEIIMPNIVSKIED